MPTSSMWKQRGSDASVVLPSLTPLDRRSSHLRSSTHSRSSPRQRLRRKSSLVGGTSVKDFEDDNTVTTAENISSTVDESKHEIYNVNDDDDDDDDDDGEGSGNCDHNNIENDCLAETSGDATAQGNAGVTPAGAFHHNKIHFGTFVGREDELERLNSIYGRICRKPLKTSRRNGHNKDIQIVLIHGYSGSGKSALVDRFLARLNTDGCTPSSPAVKNEEEGADTGEGGMGAAKKKRRADSHPCHYGKGKYDQYNTGGNLSAIADALSHFFRNLAASGDDAECQRIRMKMSRRMDKRRQDLVRRVIPGLSAVMGDAPEDGTADGTRQSLGSMSIGSMIRSNTNAKMQGDEASLAIGSMCTASIFEADGVANTNSRSKEWAQLVYTFKVILKAICTDGRPLVLYLDDLQWVDERSLKLITEILLDPSIRNLLIIGSYRSNEVHSDPKHQLTTAVSQWKSNGKTIHDIPLDDLTVTQTADLLASSLRLDAIKTAPLAKLLHDKTKGNVLYTMQALEGLRRRKVLTRNIHTLQWEWDGQRAADEIDMAANVVDLITSKLHSLPQDLQKCLQMASFLRSTFRQSVLELLIECEMEDQHQHQHVDSNAGAGTEATASLTKMSVDDVLDLAVKEELLQQVSSDDNGTSKGPVHDVHITYSGNDHSPNVGSSNVGPDVSASSGIMYTDRSDVTFRFVHDRVQQAAFSLIPPGDELDRMKHRIGKYLIEIASDPELGEDWMWFVAADHLENVSLLTASEAIIPPIDLIRLNLKVGLLAVGMAAFVPAAKYLNRALTNLEIKIADPWRTQYDLCMEVYRSLSEVELTLGNYEKGSMLCRAVIDNSGDSIENVIQVNSSLVMALSRLERSGEAMKLDLQSLKMLGTFPMRNHLLLALRDFSKVKKYFAKHTDEHVLNLPQMTDPKIKMTMTILFFLIDVAYHAGCKGTMILAMVRQIRLMLKHGLCAEGAYALTAAGSIAISVFKNVELSKRLCGLSRQLMDRLPSKHIMSIYSITVTLFITSWKEPVHVCLDQYRQGQQAGMETGNVELSYRCWIGSLMHAQLCGLPLAQLQKTGRTCITQVEHYNLQATLDTFSPWQDMAETLMGIPSTVAAHPEKSWKESFDITPLKEIKLSNYISWAYYYCSRIGLATYFGDIEAGKGYIAPLLFLAKTNNAYLVAAMRLFHSGLVLSRLAQRTKNKRKRRKYSRQAQQYVGDMKSTIELRGGNNLHRYMIMQADAMAATGKESEDVIKAAYDKAISTTARSGFIHETALANELAAEYFLLKISAPSGTVNSRDGKGSSSSSSSSKNNKPTFPTSDKLSVGQSSSSVCENGTAFDDGTDFYWPRQYLGNAISLYNEWGAKAKVEQLLEKHPGLVDRSMLEGGVDGDNGEGGGQRRKRRTTRHTADTRMCLATVHKLMAEINLDAM